MGPLAIPSRRGTTRQTTLRLAARRINDLRRETSGEIGAGYSVVRGMRCRKAGAKSHEPLSRRDKAHHSAVAGNQGFAYRFRGHAVRALE